MPVASAYAPLSTLTCTFFTPEPVSAAVPLTVTVAVFRIAPLYGEDIATVGGVVSVVIVTEIVIDVVAVFPALSVAFAIIV